MEFGIIGAGVVGSAIGIKLSDSGWSHKFVASRNPDKAINLAQRTGASVVETRRVIEECELVFITTPDREIEAVANKYAAFFHDRQLVIHCSGALSSDILRPVRVRDGRALSVHPLQSFAGVELALQGLAGTHFGIEGDDLEVGKEIVRRLGGIPHVLQTANKALYHAGACVVSNYLAVLADLGVDLLGLAGFEPEEALNCLVPLMQGTLNNIKELGLPKALTGPIARGDSEVVARHLELLRSDYKGVYRELGLRALSMGKKKGTLDANEIEQISNLLRKN